MPAFVWNAIAERERRRKVHGAAPTDDTLVLSLPNRRQTMDGGMGIGVSGGDDAFFPRACVVDDRGLVTLEWLFAHLPSAVPCFSPRVLVVSLQLAVILAS